MRDATLLALAAHEQITDTLAALRRDNWDRRGADPAHHDTQAARFDLLEQAFADLDRAQRDAVPSVPAPDVARTHLHRVRNVLIGTSAELHPHVDPAMRQRFRTMLAGLETALGCLGSSLPVMRPPSADVIPFSRGIAIRQDPSAGVKLDCNPDAAG